jgi:transcription initiation factor TFIID subunit 2
MEVRWCILKLCEVLIKPSEEPLPKLKIKMPANVLRLPSAAAGTRAGSPDVPLSVATGQSILPKIKLGGQDVSRSKEIAEAQAAPALKLVLGSGNKKTKQLKQQKSGMSMQDLKVCQNLMAKITASKNKKADLFRRPVDPIRDGAPSYFEHIKQPMDLSTISNKLDAGLYKDRFALRDDFKLMIANCYLFNGKESLPGKLADAMDAFFDKQWDRANATLEQLRLRATQANGETTATAAPAVVVNGSEAGPVNGHQAPVDPVPAAEASEVFVAPQPPTPAPVATSSSNTLRPLFKLKLSTSPNTAAQLPSKEAIPDPIKPEVETPALPPTPVGALQDSAFTFGQASSEIPPQPASPAKEAPVPAAANGHESRSASPNVPLAIAAPAAANRPKIKFMTKPKPKPEPVDEQFEFAAPAPPSRRTTPAQMSPAPMSNPPSQPSSRRTSPVVETNTHRPTFRLSLGGSNAAPAPPVPQPQYAPPMEQPAYDAYSAPSPAASYSTNNGHRPSQAPFARAASVSSAGDPYAPVNYKKMAALVRKLLSLPEAFFFQRPVDPIADGCPT